MIEVILRGSPEEIVLLTTLLKEYSDVVTEIQTQITSSEETVIKLKIDVRKTKRLLPNLFNQLFNAQAAELFQTNVGQKLQKQFEQAIYHRINETKCQQLRLQTIAIVRKNMICGIEKLIDQKVENVRSTGVTGIPILS
jgi:hypothetical protein